MVVDIIKKWFEKNKKLIIIISVMFIVFSVGNYLIYKFAKCKDVECEPVVEYIIKEDEKKQEETVYYYVDIKGAVKTPGVYKLNEESRVIDAINVAGGLTKKADTTSLNLSKKITDSMYIVIYTKEEIEKFKDNSEKVVCPENICVCPEPETNDACASIDESKDTIISNNSQMNTESTSMVSINIASKDLLQTLPGIGESKADAIIEYRNANGNFEKIEDVMNVSGIGESVYEKIKDLITL